MITHKSFKIRIYPNETQINAIENNFGCCRFLYNKMLEERQNAYREYKENNNLKGLWEHKYKTEKEYKEEFEFLKEADSTSLQQSRINLVTAYTNFFKSISGKSKSSSQFPKFHKKGINDSFRVVKVGNNIKIDFDSRKIRLPKLGYIRYRDKRNFSNWEIKSLTVSKSSTNKYFVSILCEKEIQDIIKKVITNESIIKGLDMSLKSFYVDNENNHPEYVKQYCKYLKKLKYLQRQVSKKQLNSSNRRKAQLKVNKIMEKITNSRKDFIEKLSNNLIEENDVIVIESLNIKEMSQHLNLGKSVMDLGWGIFVNRLEQKMSVTDKILIKADKYFASSKTCHICGYVNKNLNLSDREWECPKCHSHILRDQNAAINLKQYARQGLPVEPSETSSLKESMKKEA